MAEVEVEADGPVARVIINRPDRRNAVSFDALAALRQAVAEARHDPRVKVLVLTGAGSEAFCSGADLRGLTGAATGPLAAHDGRGELAGLFHDLWSLGKPTIAKVRGYALAAGLGIALACDFVVAAEESTFGAPEINVGLWPYMITVPMLRSMPAKVALDLMSTGRRVAAEEALRIGFVSRVVPSEDLDEEVAGLAALLASKSSSALRLGRDAFYSVLDLTAEQALRQLHAMLTVATSTADAAEGIRAFTEHRPPVWSGE